MTLGAFLSSGTAGVTATWLGRKSSLWVACAACIVSNILMMATENIGALYVGRLLIGLANGYFMTFSQLYIQESSPAKYRGLFLSAFQFCTSFVSHNQQLLPDRTFLFPGLSLMFVLPGDAHRYHCRLGNGEEARQIRLLDSPGHHLRGTRPPNHRHVLHPRVSPMAHPAGQVRRRS